MERSLIYVNIIFVVCSFFFFFNTSFDRLSYKHFSVGFLILSITTSQQVKQVS